ncbi:hypothetical protein Q7P35_005249 [Cladosporium inversicolor]
MSSPTASNGSVSTTVSSTAQSQYQDRLITYCRQVSPRTPLSPNYQIISDRRGGRTAWSCTVTVGSQTVHARFWYDGQYVNNAREDAAERALQCFGQLPTPAGPQPAHLQQLQQSHYGA